MEYVLYLQMLNLLYFSQYLLNLIGFIDHVEKGSTDVRITQKNKIRKEENLTEKMRSRNEWHT